MARLVTSTELENLVRIGALKREPPEPSELAGLTESGEARLKDASNPSLSLQSRFDLAYNAVHSLALVALRRLGFRPASRYVVFQTLPHTLGTSPATWRLLAKCHGLRNQAEYEGNLEVDDRLVRDLVAAALEVRDALAR